MRVWLDDTRPAPEGWVHVETPEEAIDLLKTGDVEEISFDHDLGLDDYEDGRERTGYRVLLWIEEQLHVHGIKPPKMKVHSGNLPGHERLLRGVEAIEREWEKRQREQQAGS
jgi:NAD+-processing family protein with receiver domain